MSASSDKVLHVYRNITHRRTWCGEQAQHAASDVNDAEYALMHDMPVCRLCLHTSHHARTAMYTCWHWLWN